MAEDPYFESRAMLGDCGENLSAIDALVDRIAAHPEQAISFPGRILRVMRSQPADLLPPLRVIFWLEDDVVHLLWIERYDELR